MYFRIFEEILYTYIETQTGARPRQGRHQVASLGEIDQQVAQPVELYIIQLDS